MRRVVPAQAAYTAPTTAQAACQALEGMAAQLLQDGSYLPAFKCLEALAMSTCHLPADAARIRLQVPDLPSVSSTACSARPDPTISISLSAQLAKLVLQRTSDAAVARFHLERAVRQPFLAQLEPIDI